MQNERKVVLFIATSLDGYIATKEESLEWLFEVEGEGDNGIAAFYDTTDTVIMGRKTYDWIKEQDDSADEPYSDRLSYVFTRTPRENSGHTQFITEDPASFVKQLKQEEGQKIWLVGGGELIASFIQAGLLDEIIVTIAPKLIGAGIPLFLQRDSQMNLRLRGVQTFNQFVELHYHVEH